MSDFLESVVEESELTKDQPMPTGAFPTKPNRSGVHLRKQTLEALNALHAAHAYVHSLELQIERHRVVLDRARAAETNAYARFRTLRAEALTKELIHFREELDHAREAE